MINRVILLGNLGNAPETRQTSNGDPICSVSIATFESWKDKATGERKTKTEWHKIVVLGSAAKYCSEFAKKGAKVYIEGRMQTRKWTDKSGLDKWITEVAVDNGGTFKIISSGEDRAAPVKEVEKVTNQEIEMPEADIDDDIPF